MYQCSVPLWCYSDTSCLFIAGFEMKLYFIVFFSQRYIANMYYVCYGNKLFRLFIWELPVLDQINISWMLPDRAFYFLPLLPNRNAFLWSFQMSCCNHLLPLFSPSSMWNIPNLFCSRKGSQFYREEFNDKCHLWMFLRTWATGTNTIFQLRNPQKLPFSTSLVALFFYYYL